MALDFGGTFIVFVLSERLNIPRGGPMFIVIKQDHLTEPIAQRRPQRRHLDRSGGR
jgi:hypothetical protein